MSTVDPARINRAAWSSAAAIDELDVDGWSDPGERTALVALADVVRGGQLLEIGVGTGRLVPMLRLISARYTGVDFTDPVLERARARYPHVDLRHDDARVLSTVPDASIDGVVFGFNGIDAINHEDRLRVLAAVHRVLTPNGWFLYSTLNQHGAAYHQRPWRVRPLPWVVGSLRPISTGRLRGMVFSGYRLASDPRRPQRIFRNWRHLRGFEQLGSDHATGLNDAHEFGLLLHFTTPAAEIRQLAAAGFEVTATFTAEDGGAATAPRPDQPRWFHVLARRSADVAAPRPAR